MPAKSLQASTAESVLSGREAEYRYYASVPVFSRFGDALTHLLLLGLFGPLMVMAAMELVVFFILPVWLALLARWTVRRWKTEPCERIVFNPVIQLIGMYTIVAIAGMAPLKHYDRCLAERFTLPKQTFTVQELEFHDQFGVLPPRPLQFDDMEGLYERTVTFPCQAPSLQEFIATVEQQLPLKGMLHPGCGNGATILWGPHPGGVYFSRRD